MRESATRNIEAAKRAALREIYSEAAVLSTTVAAKILEREVNEQDQHRLVEESLAEVSNEYARG
jgi:F-type H+-transporting ATPase subunit b